MSRNGHLDDPGSAVLAEPRDRGRLRISQTVVQRIAAQAASEAGAAGGRTGGVFGIGARTDPNTRPKVKALLSGESIDLTIDLAIDYPVSVRGAAQEVRNHLSTRVESLTGVPVHRIDIEVVAMGMPDRSAEGGLR